MQQTTVFAIKTTWIFRLVCRTFDRDVFLYFCKKYEDRVACVRLTEPRPGVHNLFALASRITFRFMNYGLQWVQDTYIFCIASVLHAHTKSGLLAHVRFATKYPHTVDEEFLLMHGPHSYCTVAFQLHAHGRINFYRRPWPDVPAPALDSGSQPFWWSFGQYFVCHVPLDW